jgi:hypothetical protein
MDAPWGLLTRVAMPVAGRSNAHLDSTVAMAYFDPELGPILAPNAVIWSGTLLAPRTGIYRMAFAAEDRMRLQIDGAPVDVAVVSPDDWRTVGIGSGVQLTAGAHRVVVALDVSHGGRDLARWNWVPPRADGTPDASTPWTVVPPAALRPEASVELISVLPSS